MGNMGRFVIVFVLLALVVALIPGCSFATVKVPPVVKVKLKQPLESSREVGLASVQEAIDNAAEKTGVSATYLKQVAVKESGLNPMAKNPRSSAKGLYQFINSTWIETVRKHGKTYNVAYTDRLDIKKESLMMGALTNDNREYLEKKLGREVNYKELYLAHFAGPAKAAKLLKTSPSKPVTAVFSAAEIKANPFLKGLTVGQAIAKLGEGISP